MEVLAQRWNDGGDGSGDRFRGKGPTFGLVVALVIVALLSIGFLGGSDSESKFESVGSAVCRRGPGRALGRCGDVGGNIGGDSAERDTAGQSGSGEAADEDSSDTKSSAPGDGSTDDEAADSGSSTGDLVSVGQGPLVDSGRKIISTASLGVTVSDVSAAASEAVVIGEAAGAVLFGQNSTYGDEPHALLTFKVAPEGFVDLQRKLADLGKLVAQEVTTDDVTEQVVDLESRITTSEASVERLRGLMGETRDVGQIAALENELLRRETDLETLRGQIRTLQDRIDLATVVLTLTEEGDSTPEKEKEPPVISALVHDDGPPGFLDGLAAGWSAFVEGGTITLAVLGAALPFLVVLAAAFVAWRRVARLGSRRRAPAA